MANFFPVEFVGIFMVFYVTYKLKFQKFIISLLFRNQVVYLPLTDDDFKKLMELSKENKENKTQDKVLIRSCEFKEYSEKSQSIKYHELDFLVFIYFCNFIIYFFNIIYKIFRLIILGKERSPFLLNEEQKQDNNEASNEEFNLSIYLCLSFIIYIIYRELRNSVFINGFFGKFAKEFYICFIFCFALFFLNEYYNEKLFNLNYESSINIINNRIDLILAQANAHFDIDIRKIHIKIFYSFLFALISGIFLRSSQRGAYFDNFFCNVSKTSQFNFSVNPQSNSSYNSEKSENKVERLEYISKIQSIAITLVLAIIFNPLLDNFLEVIDVFSGVKKLVIIFILLCLDFILGFFILWYAYFMFSVQNYQEIMKFVKRPNQQYLIYHQRSVDFINENAWDVLTHIFLNCFFLFYVFNCYLNEINIFEIIKIKDEENNNIDKGFNNGFVDNILFVVFLGTLFSKGIVQNFIFFYRLITKERHLTLT